MNASNNRMGMGILIACGLILVAYHAPWVVNPGVSLTLNAPDLAEWTTLHPAEASDGIALMTGLLLRLPLLALAAVSGLSSGQCWSMRWWVAAGFIVVLAALAAPPLEFVTEARDNTNYRQEFMLALAVVIVGGIGLSGLLRRWYRPIAGIVTIVVIPAMLIGLARAYNYMSDFYIPAQIGLGGLVTAALFAALGLRLAGLPIKNRTAR